MVSFSVSGQERCKANSKYRLIFYNILNKGCKNCSAFVLPGFENLPLCSAAMGRIYEVWLLLLHAPTARIPARSWCGWRPTGHALLTPLSLKSHYHNCISGLWYLNREEKLEHNISWWGHGDLSWGIAGDLMVQGISLECSGSGYSLRREQ